MIFIISLIVEKGAVSRTNSRFQPYVNEIKSSNLSIRYPGTLKTCQPTGVGHTFTKSHLLDQVGGHVFAHVAEAEEGDILVYFRAISSFGKCEVLDGEGRPRRHVEFLI